ncbi:PAS domain S-box protein [Mariniflexile sp.]|uniref:PAS domain S-box protein n=1 Tax=Mariniflexile sp. TaxID=1979402 RepID=UPI00356610CD
MEEIAITQLLILFSQCVLIGSLLLFLFKLRSIFGLGLIFTALGVFQFMQTFLVAAFYIEIIPGILVSPGSMVLFTGSLFAILLIYIREDALEARKVIYAIFAANLVLAAVQVIFGWSVMGQNFVNVYNLPDSFFTINSRMIIAGTLALFIDAFAIIFIYEFISRYISRLFLRILFTMTIVVCLDSILFSIGGFAGTALFSNVLISGLLAKVSSTLIYSFIFWAYLSFIEKETSKFKIDSKPFKDIFHTLTYRQKYEQASLERKSKVAELHKKEIQFQILFESMSQGVTYQNALGEIIDANPAAERILGLTLQQMQGKTSMDPNWRSIHEDGTDFPGKTHASMVALRTGKVVNNVIMGVYNPKNDDYRWIKIHATPLFKNSEKKPYQVFTTFEDITQEKHTQQNLKELYTKYQNIIHTANIGIVELDKNTNYTFVNPAWEAMFGYESHEILGINKTQILQKDQPTNLLLQKLINGEISNYQIERKYQAKDGKTVWCDLYVAANNDLQGNLKSIVGVMIDITKKKQWEIEIKEKEQILREALLEAERSENLLNETGSLANVGAWELHLDTMATYFSKQTYNIHGLPVGELPKVEEGISFYAPEAQPVIKKALNEAINNHIPYDLELPFINAKGKELWVRTLGQIEVKNGKATRLYGAIQDITVLKESILKLQKSEEKYRDLVEYSHDLIWAIDATGTFTFFNKASKPIYGYEPEEIIGKSIFSFIPKSEIEKEKANFEVLFKTNIELLNYESQFTHKDGKTIHILSNVRILHSDSGTFIGATGISKNITDRKLKEEELKTSEERFRNIVEGAPDPIFIQTNNCFAYLNKLAIKLFGVKDEKELLGKPVLDYFHTDFHSKAMERMKSLNVDKKEVHEPFEQILLKIDGNKVWVETKGQPIFYNGINGGLVFVRDITQRKKAEKELNESKALLQGINDNLPGVITQYKLYPNGQDEILYVSEGSKEIWEIEPQDAVKNGKLIWNQIDEDYVDVVQKSIEASFKNLSPWHVVYKNNLPNGTVKWIEGIGIPKKQEDNSIIWDSIMLDITEKKNAEFELHKSESKYKLLAENITDVVSLHNTDATYEYVSPSIKQIRGFEPDELIGKNPYDYIHPDDIQETTSQVHIDRLLKGLPTKMIYRALHKNGEYKWFESNRQPIMNEKNEIIKIVSSSRDITERIEKDIEINNYQKSLQNLTTEMMLAEEKQRKAIAANIHDHLSQSLVISKMKLNDLSKETKTDTKRKEIETIIKHISEALENTRKITYDLSPPVLYELGLIEAIYWLSEKIEDENNIKVQFITEFDEINLDEPKLILIYRAIQELLTNAIKHADSKQIDIFFIKQDYGLKIVVKDKGKGFDKTTIKDKKNTQFGLFAVKERIENLQGNFSINSSPGLGTKVELFVPLKTNEKF